MVVTVRSLMRKLFYLLPLLATTASAAFIPVTSVTISTGGVTAAQGPAGTQDWRMTLSTALVNQGTPGTNDWRVTMGTAQVTQANAWNVVSTNTVVSGGVNIVQPGSEVLATSGTITGALPTGTNNIGTVTGSTMTINNPSGVSLNVNITGGAAITSNFTSNTTAAWNISPFPGQGQVIAGIGPSGLPQAFRVDIDSNIYEIQQVLVSSVTTFPNPQPNGSSTTAMGDPYGRAVTVAGAPTSVWLTTAPSTSGAGFMVLVASPTGTLFTHVCGCMFTNTSATAVQATIYPSGGVVNPNVVLQLVAGDTRGIWPGCDKPFLNTTAGGVEISAKISAAVSSISGYCQYIQNQTP